MSLYTRLLDWAGVEGWNAATANGDGNRSRWSWRKHTKSAPPSAPISANYKQSKHNWKEN